LATFFQLFANPLQRLLLADAASCSRTPFRAWTWFLDGEGSATESLGAGFLPMAMAPLAAAQSQLTKVGQEASSGTVGIKALRACADDGLCRAVTDVPVVRPL